ncbi:MAG TPA: LacI family DNA-binding transcriptional regulator [Ilumatobacter sp.]|nr:LacI family DNA-binding transcriptional regulator [Ilumatobacter sp.]
MPKPTMDDVARRAGVSRALVSLALRGSDKVAEGSMKAVLAAAEELGYRPNLIARNLASKRTRTIGLIINDLHNPYFPGIADGAHDAVGRLGYRLLMNSAFLSPRDEISALEMFIDLQVDGVILTGGMASAKAIDFGARSVPLIVVSRPLESQLVDTVNNDDFLGSTMVIEHLIGLGHRHIAHVSGGPAAGAPQRLAGYEETMRRHGLERHVELGSFTERSGVAAAQRVLASGRPCTAIFAGNDLSALGVLDVLDAAGRRVPEDISLVGYDNTYVGALRHIGLTSVEQRRHEQGQLAVELLIERIEHGRTEAVQRVVVPSLVVRGTTAPPPTP